MQTHTIELDAQVRTTCWLRSVPGAHLALVVLPALGIEARYYQRALDSFADLGISCAVADYRGVGSSLPLPSRAHDFDFVTRLADFTLVLEGLLPRLGAARVVLLGHSLGGQLALLHAARTPAPPYHGIAMVGSVMPYYRAFGRQALRTLVGTCLAQGCARALGYFPGNRLGFGGVEARSLIGDWARAARSGRYVLRGVDQSPALAQLRLPVLAMTLAGDELAPRSAAEYVATLVPNTRYRRVHLHAGDQPLAVDHNRWPRSPGPIVEQVASWARSLEHGVTMERERGAK